MSEVITDNLDLWTSALFAKYTAGRGSNGKQEAHGIKKLRELILELAVRGRLVPQDSNDEPASELLKKTISEKKRLIKGGVIRESKPPVSPIESPDNELPASWVWTNLFEIGEIAPRNEADDSVEASFIPMQAISEKYGVPVQYEVKTWGEIKSGFTHFREEDVVLAKITPCFQNGKSAVMRRLANGFGSGTTELHVYRAINSCTVPEYVLIYLKSPRFIGNGIPKMTGTAGQKRITRDYFAGNHFPLPPLAEQHRIVAKVDELMALCDQLEQQQTHSIEAHQTLVETLLGTLTRVGSQQEFSAAWARIASHFDILFTTEHSIDQLKQTILQLAVMGKLVPQDPNDEPASVLLKKIANEKEQLAIERKTKTEMPLPVVSDDEKRFQLPDQWEWVRFGSLVSFKSELVRPEDFADLDQVAPDSIEKGTGKLLYRRTVNESGVRGPNNRFYRGQILYSKIRPSLSKVIIAPFDGLCSADMYPLEAKVNAAFLLKVILSEPFLEQVRVAENRIKMPKLNVDSLSRMVVPVAPLAEQHRIAAKVDELMALCDALQARLKDAQTTQLHLADAIVEQAVR